MKLFLSWSGSQSKVVAEALSQFLVDAIHDLRPWISSKSIDPGKRWSDVLEKELKDTSYAILCVTNSNINAPWLNFEAGAISSGFSGVMICPYLINIEPSDIRDSPLGTFQACQADRDGTFALISSINKHLADQALTTEQLRRSFQSAWPAYKRILSAAVNQANRSDSIFVSAPITSLPNSTSYRELRTEVLEAMEHLKEKFGKNTIYSAVQRLNDQNQVEPERIGFQRDIAILQAAQRFVLFYPHNLASSVLFEAGYAYALKKPSVYFVKKGVSLPFALEGATRHSSDLVNKLEYKNREDLDQLIDKHHIALFPSRE